MKNSEGKSGGIGFLGLLTIVFITLKLIGLIRWSWLWILSPIWISTLVILFIFIISFVIVIIKNNKKEKH